MVGREDGIGELSISFPILSFPCLMAIGYVSIKSNGFETQGFRSSSIVVWVERMEDPRWWFFRLVFYAN